MRGGAGHPDLAPFFLPLGSSGQRIPLSDMTREEINALLQELGFYRKEAPDAPVPPEHLEAPAKPVEGAPDPSSEL